MLKAMKNAAQLTVVRPAGVEVFAPQAKWWGELFAAIDSSNAAAFVGYLTPDARFQFGNSEALIGSHDIGAGVTAFFRTIASSRHHLRTFWNTPDCTGCEGDVTYVRHDGTTVTFPFANVFTLQGEKVASYRIYIDNSTLFGVAR